MPQENTLSQLLDALDAFNQLKWNYQLVEIAIDHCEKHTEENFDRITLLLERYNSVYGCYSQELQLALDKLQHELTIQIPVQTQTANTQPICSIQEINPFAKLAV
jgi:hypothetical protein